MKIKHKILIYNVAALSSSLFAPLLINNTMSISQTRTTTANASVRVSNFCSMTANIQPGEEHSTTLIGGQYQSDIGKTTIQTFCNDPNGYAIYAIGYTGGDEGVAEGTNTVLHSDALGSNYDIVTGIAQSGDTSNWAMKLTSVDGTYKPDILSDDSGSFSDYHTVPQSYTKVADFNSNTDATIGSSLTTTYAVYVKPTQPAGTYEGQVKYVLVHPATVDINHYYMQDVESWSSLIAVGQEITAYDNRDNKSYTIRRMCMEGTGSTWQEKEANCTRSMLWMTQNLDLDLNSSIALNSVNTDINSVGDGAYVNGYSIDDYGIINWIPANYIITDISPQGYFSGWIPSNNVPSSVDPDVGNLNDSWHITGAYFQSNQCLLDNNNQTCNYLEDTNTVAPAYFQRSSFVTNGNHGKIGNYYSWSAAIASNASNSFSTSTYNNVTNNPQNSICPRGWRLPIISNSTSENEFTSIGNVYNDSKSAYDGGFFNAPIFMTRAGLVQNYYQDYAGLQYAGYYGFYWSSTVADDKNAYSLAFRSDSVNPQYNNSNLKRNTGQLIRCVSDY